MKRALFTLCFILFFGSLFSQNCPPNGDITFTTQQQVDNFAIDYPGCSEVDVLTIGSGISGSSITNLDGLSQLTTVGSIIIINNSSLQDINGLQNVSGTVRSIHLASNSSLVNLSGLENLIGITGGGITTNYGLSIENNDALTDISALSNLNQISPSIGISFNDVLPNLTGLENIVSTPSLEGIVIRYNDILSDISAIDISSNFMYIHWLGIYDNPNLSMCSQQGVCYYLASGRIAEIHDNAPGCNTRDEILDICNIADSVCPVGDIILTSQSQLDSFAINHFNCNRIFGNLTISSPTITNLYPLFQIDTIDGDFNICDNPNLSDLDGLSSIYIGGDFWFKNNDAIRTLNNYFDFNGGVHIVDNSNLQSIAGMTYNMPNITYLQITGNSSLGFCTVATLSDSDTPPFDDYTDMCNYLIAGEPSEINSNAIGCNSANELITYCITLPITLTDFQAKINNKATLLTWQTATESNNAGFEIQRSADAINWEKIAWQDGQGTTTNAHTYTHRDENLLFGTSYYRLKQVDFDGAFEYTHIVQVNYEGRDISIFPNPVKNTLHISDLNGESIQHISIYDQTGRAILSQQISDNTIDVSALSPGMYILKIAVEGEVFCRKFIVQERK